LPVNTQFYNQLKEFCVAKNVTLVAVSKTKPIEDILELYDLGQRDFGENYVQELLEKHKALPKDIRWHFIGHLQSNKVKVIAPFISLIQSVDSKKLLAEINKQAKKNNRNIDCLLEVFIAKEETKFGLDEKELKDLVDGLEQNNNYPNIIMKGLMGMASFTEDKNQVKEEFRELKRLSNNYSKIFSSKQSPILSMGMSADYKLAIEEGSNLIRIGSSLFGERNKV
jgi:hypothetical protein